MAEFDDWAALYDMVHSGLPGEKEFYTASAQKAKGTVLDLGCGTGRISIPIAQLGIPTIGLDISRLMLDRCSAKWKAICESGECSENDLQLVHGDMTTYELDREFSLILMPYRTFMHLLRPNEQRKCLDTVAAHLEESGRFIMNIWVPSAAYIHAYSTKPEEPEHTHIDTYQHADRTLEHYHFVYCSEFNQEMLEEHLLIATDADGKEEMRKCLPLLRTWITPREMRNLIAASPLEVEAVYGDFDETPLDAQSTESIWVLKHRV